MPKLVDNYSLGEQIGQGAYGKVYKAKHIITNQYYAVKVVSNQKFRQNEKLRQCFANQKKTLTTIRSCKHIIRYVTQIRTENNYYFVYEYCNGGTLEAMIKKQKRFTQAKAFHIFKQLLQAFKVLYEYKVIHRDTKPQNILFHNGIVKLADFGFCKGMDNCNDMTATMLGSPIYMAPEVLKGQSYTNKIDVWSLGTVLYQMLFGVCPFQSKSIVQLISTIKDTQIRFPIQINRISDETKYLIKRMLVKQSNYRMRWEELFTLDLSKYDEQKTNQKQIQNQQQKPRQIPIQRGRQIQRQRVIERQKSYNFNISHQPLKQRHKSMDRTTSSDGINLNLMGYSYDSNNKPSYKITQQIFPSTLPNFAKYFDNKPSKPSYALTGSAIIHSPLVRRKTIVQQHQFCTKGIKVSIDIINISDKNTLAYSYLVLLNVQSRLNKIKQSISYSDTDLEDILSIVKCQLQLVSTNLCQLKQQLLNQNFDMKMISDVKIYLSVKFRQFDCDIKVWYEMINFLFGDKSFMNTRDKNKEEMINFIKQKLR